MHPAIQLCLRHNGKVVLNRAIGHGWERPRRSPRIRKGIGHNGNAVLRVLRGQGNHDDRRSHALERGYFSLDDRVCDYLPNYTSHGKDRTTIRHVMTHSAGVPLAPKRRPDVNRMDDTEYAREGLGELRPLYRPGLVHVYHAATWGILTREIVSAATGRNIREILANEILDPLGFRWTNYGVAAHDVTDRAESCHGQAVARADRGDLPQGDRRIDPPDRPVHEHTVVPHRGDAVLEHCVDRKRALPFRRDPASRR